MSAQARVNVTTSAPVRKGGETPRPAPASTSPLHTAAGLSPPRQAACACGGGCPRCAEGAEHGALQAKLQISTPDDPFEQEADRVADVLMSMPATVAGAHAPSSKHSGAGVARKDAPRGVEAAPVGLVPGAGQPLAPSAKAFFEPRFGQDFGRVRVHTDARAAESARRMHALAYTFGRDIVFAAGMYRPDTQEGRKLLAHELVHVVQQGAGGEEGRGETAAANASADGPSPSAPAIGVANRPAPPHAQRQAADPDTSGPCTDDRSANIIEPAFTAARRWRRAAAEWLESHLDHIRARGRLARDGYVRVGRLVFNELMFLERHFRISDVLRVPLPHAPDDLVSVPDLERYGNASYWVRRRFGEVELTLSYLCQTNCPRGRTGSDVLGSAVAGMREVVFYTNCFDPQHETTRAGVALHEAFHASFSEFNHDTYSFEGNYPGRDPMTNAESFAAFAAYVATGRNYRIVILPSMTIRAGP